ncbi:MAG: metal-dependent hydrolase [Halovenus sp.]
MMIGHAALAFAIAGWVSHRAGYTAKRALLVGIAAGAFAVVPDVDMGYALVGLATAGTTDPSVLLDTFWDAGLTVHRGMTHSLVVSAVAALAFGLIAARGVTRTAGLTVLVGMVVATAVFVGGLGAGVMVSFVVAGTAVALGAARVELGPREVLGAALVGLLTHPFGDLFTGTTPVLLYPLDLRILPERVILSGDATLHLLGAFAIEVATVWLALAVYLQLRDQPLGAHVHRRAVLGVGYAAAVLALPPPTLAVSYHFVFSVLAVGVIVGSADISVPSLRSAQSRRAVFLTGLTAVTVAWLSYTVAYVVVSYGGPIQTI